MKAKTKKDIQTRLRRMRGQIEGLERSEREARRKVSELMEVFSKFAHVRT